MSSKILIVGPSWVGDMVMAQTLFRLLKAQNAATVIDVLAPDWTFSLLARMPEVSLAIASPFSHGELNLRGRLALAKTLRRNQYDQAIVLPHSLKSALIPWLAGIPVRTGWLGEYRYGFLNDRRRLDAKRYPLMIEQYMALGLPANTPLSKPYLYPHFTVSEEAQAQVLKKHAIHFSKKPILGLAAGAEFGPAKRWPAEYYAQVAKQKLSEGWEVWLFGSQKDKVITDEIMHLTDHRCENLAGRPVLSETIDLLSLVSGLVSNDSGLMHVAAALNKPLVAIYGSTSPGFTPPLSRLSTILQQTLPCQPCFQRACPLTHHNCMRHLLPVHVLSAISTWGLDARPVN